MLIQTVCGAVDTADLGLTLMHEHLFIGYSGWELDPSYIYDRQALIGEAIRRLVALKAHGVATFVDPAPIELGRDVALMREVSERSGVQIICSTGFYFEGHGLPAYWRMRSQQEIADFLHHEIEHGVGGTGIRPGIIKCATGGRVPTALEARFLAAAAQVQLATGTPITTHTEGGAGGLEQLDLFQGHGVPAHRCLIGHSCGNPDPNYHRALLARGAWIGFDRIGYAKFQDDGIRARNICALLAEDHVGKMVISQDRYCSFLGKSVPPAMAKEREAVARLSRDGLWPPHHTYLFTDFLPRLRAMGVTEGQIETLLVDNPRRFLGG